MALDVSGFQVDQPDFGGEIGRISDSLYRRQYRDQQLQLSKEGREQSASSFLSRYLDKSQFLTGTDYDPMTINMLNNAMSEGIQLASKGADMPTIMMSLGPIVGKINGYVAKAKAVKSAVDDKISGFKENKYTGFDYGAIKDLAMKNAFYADGKFDPDKADPSVDYVSKVIQENPNAVTTNSGLDEYAKNAPLGKRLSDITTYNSSGGMTKQKAHLIGQSYLVPDVDNKGVTTGLVPKYDIHTDGGEPLMHTFEKDGKKVQAPVRMLDEQEFDNMMQRPDVAYRIIGQVKDHLDEYKNGGKDISLDSPEAKRVARAIAYDELKLRSPGSIENVGVYDKPSNAQINLSVGSSPEYMNMLQNQSQAREQGRQSVLGTNKKTSTLQALGKIFNGDPDYKGETVKVNGEDMEDVTPFLPGGKLKVPQNSNMKYGNVYKKGDNLYIETQTKNKYGVWEKSDMISIPKSDAVEFGKKIAATHGSNPDKAESEMGIQNTEMQDRLDEMKKKKQGGLLNSIKSLFGF